MSIYAVDGVPVPHAFDPAEGVVLRWINPDGNDGGYVAETAKVTKGCYIGPNCKVYDQAVLGPHVELEGTVTVRGNVTLAHNVRVCGNVLLNGNAHYQNTLITRQPLVIQGWMDGGMDVIVTDTHICVGGHWGTLNDLKKHKNAFEKFKESPRNRLRRRMLYLLISVHQRQRIPFLRRLEFQWL